MSDLLQVWDSALALPASYEEGLRLYGQIKDRQPGPNPKFVALARALHADPAVAGRWWANRLVGDAQACEQAVWAPSLAPDDAMPGLRAAIGHALAHGLVVYLGQPQMFLLPGGAALPPDRKAVLDETCAEYDTKLRDRVDACRWIVDAIGQRLASHGFSRGEPEPGFDCRGAFSFTSGSLAQFIRPMADGWQRIRIGISEHKMDSEHLRCSVQASLRNESVEAIVEDIFGPARRWSDKFGWEVLRGVETFAFSPAVFTRKGATAFPIAGQEALRALPELIERHAMPVLALARTVDGLDQVMNVRDRFPFAYPVPPTQPGNLADMLAGGREVCLNRLVVAWLAGNPAFAQRVEDLRAFVRNRVDVTEVDLEKAAAHLRALAR